MGSLPFKLWLSKRPSPVITRLDSLIIFSRLEIFFNISNPFLIFEFNSPYKPPAVPPAAPPPLIFVISFELNFLIKLEK